MAVFPDASGDLQGRAATAGAPLSVFLEGVDETAVKLRVFTPGKEKGESDSASIAALHYVQEQGMATDLIEVQTGESLTTAQECGGEWLLNQGLVTVSDLQLDLKVALPGFTGVAHVASTARPNLVLEVSTLAALDSFQPDAEAISELNRQTNTTGLILYTRNAPTEGTQRRADVSYRCFGPLKGFLEDAASSNMFACLTGVLLRRGLLPTTESLVRGAQRKPGAPASLTAQYLSLQQPLWVGGKARVTAH